MGSTWLSRLISYPRKRFQQEGVDLDLAFVTDQICVMSLPSLAFPERLYRNHLPLVKQFLDTRAPGNYWVFDFRAEGAGQYDDEEFESRVSHFRFVDHHPPPFETLPKIVDGMHAHLSKGPEKLAVIHCKAGKGRSGLGTCSYLVTHCGWAEEDARKRFTERRMRPGFGEGLSIPSQCRYLRYVQRWSLADRLYAVQRVKIDALRIENLKPGCQLAIKRFENEGTKISTLHSFNHSSRELCNEGKETVVLTPSEPLVMDNDICIYLEKGHAFAHFWFNTYFEASRSNNSKKGQFRIEWHEVDGWKGTKWRGTKAYDAITVEWTVLSEEERRL